MRGPISGQISRIVAIVIPLCLSIFAGIDPLSVRAFHGEGPLLAVAPESVGVGLNPGDSFAIRISVDEVGQFNVYDISLRYELTVLTATGATLLPVQGESFVEIVSTVIDDSTGTVSITAGLTGGRTVIVTGSDPLFSVNFKVDSIGTSALDLTNDRIFLGGDEIFHQTKDGIFSNVAEETGPIVGVWSSIHSSSNITDPTLKPPRTFTVDINITSASSISGFDLTLLYDADFILSTTADLKTGTIFGDQTVELRKDSATPGEVRLAAVKLGQPPFDGDGTLAHITFRVLKETAISPLGLTNVRLVQHVSGETREIAPRGTIDGYFKNSNAKTGPVAEFIWTPTILTRGTLAAFDASLSYDPDNIEAANRGISLFKWVWDDGQAHTTGNPIISHTFGTSQQPFFGDFWVRLTVVDSDGFKGLKITVVHVSEGGVQDLHDVGITSLQVFPTSVPAGAEVAVRATAKNAGSFYEIVDLTFFLDGSVLRQFIGQNLAPGESFVFGHDFRTTDLAPGLHEIKATVEIELDENPNNNFDTTPFTILPGNRPPIANLTFSPQNPLVGELVFFDGDGSTDPDGRVVEWRWDFGDNSLGFGTYTSHTYFTAGTFTVTLTVFDDKGASDSASASVSVRSRPMHDVSIARIDAFPREAVSSQFVSIQVVVRNLGPHTERVDLTVYYDSQIIDTITGLELEPGPYSVEYVFIFWDTLEVPAGSYTLSATIFLETDEFPDDNTLVDGRVTILPQPVLTVSPSGGNLATRVLVKGSGFPAPLYGPFSPQLFVTFDDMFLGIAAARDGKFEFTFNVPHAEPGIHEIKAFDPSTGAKAKTAFEVLATSGSSSARNLTVVVDSGVLYFPGDNVEVYVLVSLDGVSPGPEKLQLEVTLYKPDGTTVALEARPFGPGLYKASYSIPRSGALGTYTIVVGVQYAIISDGTTVDTMDGSALRSFQVKPTWLSTQGPRIGSATALVGALALIAVAWRKGYLKRDKETPSLTQLP